jgi:hyperosmotically inducible periplasmic protein
MRRRLARLVTILGLGVWFVGTPLAAQNEHPTKHPAGEEKAPEGLLIREIRHQLQVLPFYSVFDHLGFSLQGANVTLSGQVVRPTLKAHALAAIRSIEGVGPIVDQIEVLPVSSSDDELRRTIYRAIYEDSTLKRYAIQALPAIHIIVKNGAVTLEGVVDSEADKNLAGTRSDSANPASLKNNLVVHKRETPVKVEPQ